MPTITILSRRFGRRSGIGLSRRARNERQGSEKFEPKHQVVVTQFRNLMDRVKTPGHKKRESDY